MTLVSWSPLREFEDIFGRYGRLPARQAMNTGGSQEESAEWRPVANISETEKEYLIKAELPEVAKDDIEVTVNEGVITIKGERRFETTEENEKQHRIESFYGSFSRSFSLPPDIAEDAIHAESRDGILKVHIPKAAIEKPKSIDIRVS
ncbi:MAG: Hsp20/alpha crystallin family protein [Gammaproteobacteria bacterium]|jgi:HSP20 family protein|nr:Hsp20/alpha crystallin family protein [Gammaproteobacteria bacterium]